MKRVLTIVSVQAIQFSTSPLLPSFIAIAASGQVETSGWTSTRLLPRFYIGNPPDGIWDFDLVADAPIGLVADVLLPVAALQTLDSIPGIKGIRVHGEKNFVESLIITAGTKRLEPEPMPLAINAIVEQTIASYDDSFQPTGTIHWHNDGPFGTPNPHAEMKKLHHTLTLHVNGPDEARIRDCINKALGAGLIAGIITAFATGGLGAASAAISAATAALLECLTDSYTVTFTDDSYWVYWDT
jgi:hypothetical protein